MIDDAMWIDVVINFSPQAQRSTHRNTCNASDTYPALTRGEVCAHFSDLGSKSNLFLGPRSNLAPPLSVFLHLKEGKADRAWKDLPQPHFTLLTECSFLSSSYMPRAPMGEKNPRRQQQAVLTCLVPEDCLSLLVWRNKDGDWLCWPL